jgi:hypothetical protein
VAQADIYSDGLYSYPGLTENYHLGLTKLLADQMLVHHTGLSAADQRVLLLHSVSCGR